MSLRLGLIGGLGVGATIFYYQHLVRAFVGCDEPPQILIAHADMPTVLGHVQRGERVELAEYLGRIVASLRDGGAEIAAVSAVAPHVCIGELVAVSPIPVVNLLEAVGAKIRSRGIRRVALFGTRFAIESDLFGGLTGVDVVRPEPGQIDFIHATYSGIAQRGSWTEEERRGLVTVARELCEGDVESVVLAGTDLSPMFDPDEPDFPMIDASRVHVEAIVAALGPKR